MMYHCILQNILEECYKTHNIPLYNSNTCNIFFFNVIKRRNRKLWLFLGISSRQVASSHTLLHLSMQRNNWEYICTVHSQPEYSKELIEDIKHKCKRGICVGWNGNKSFNFFLSTICIARAVITMINLPLRAISQPFARLGALNSACH